MVGHTKILDTGGLLLRREREHQQYKRSSSTSKCKEDTRTGHCGCKKDRREREMRHKGQNPHIPDNLNLRKRRIVRGTSSAHSQRGPTAGLQSRETVDRNKERVETPLQPRDFARKNQWSQQFPASLVPPDAQERKPVQGIAPISARTPPPPH